MRTKVTSRLSLLFMAFAMLLALPAMAFADQIANNVDATVDATAEVMPLQVGGANGSTQLSVISTGGDGKNGCNLTGQTSASFSVNSSDPSVATASPTSVTFTGCGEIKTLTVTPKAQGSTTLSLGQTSNNTGGTFDLTRATFTVNVSAAPPSNTPPQVTVNGVTHGVDYEKGSVPPATCQVTDAEDSNESATPAIDSINLDSYGLGQQTVTCSYTDAGGLKASSSKTYNIVDTTAPVIAAHANVTEEATDANGALVDYTNPTANDAVYGSVNVDCAPASGSQFALGSTTVTCNATDEAGNKADATTFTVKVQDTTAPTLTVPSDPVVVEATGPTGAVATYQVSAKDAVDANPSISCTPATGTVFGLGTTQVTCTAKDAAGNISAEKSFDVTVKDTTAPAIAAHDDVTEEATGSNGALISYTSPGTKDAVDGDGTATCTPASGSQFALGSTTVTCNATDEAGNKADATTFTVKVQDTTAPKLNLPANITEEATGPNGNVVNYSASASDLVSGNVNVTCTPASGSTFGITTTTVNCSAKDAAGNEATGGFTVKVQDTIAPNNIQFVGNINDGDSFFFGDVPAQPTCTATDSGSGLNAAGCVVTGYGTTVGTHTLTATATDKAGNTATKALSYTVKPYSFNGFYQPVDMSTATTTVWNTVKGGSTVPLKFELFKGANELTDTSAIKSLTSTKVACTTGAGIEDAIETVATGGTSLRYDSTGGQFIYNWKTPTGAGTCYKVTLTAQDGSTLSAYFKMK